MLSGRPRIKRETTFMYSLIHVLLWLCKMQVFTLLRNLNIQNSFISMSSFYVHFSNFTVLVHSLSFSIQARPIYIFSLLFLRFYNSVKFMFI